MIDLRHLRLRRDDPISPLGVIGQKQKAGCLAVEPSDRENPSVVREKIIDRFSPLFIRPGGDDPFRLVHHKVALRCGPDDLIIDLKALPVGIDSHLRIL